MIPTPSPHPSPAESGHSASSRNPSSIAVSGNVDWWKQAVVYQIYPRSFRDANGDGIGDMQGITQGLGHLAKLGVDAIWLSPFYPSPLEDGGYDVADYRNVDPRLGTLDDFDAMVAAAHRHGIRVIADLVPNHTSAEHPWFREALEAAADSPARERYIFRDGRGEHGELPPTDWVCGFGGSAWERVADGQWYLHMWSVGQPDLNWNNPEVREDFLKTIRFWSDRGVDGFRVDAAQSLVKDMDRDDLNDWSLQYDVLPDDGSHPMYDRDDLHNVYREWRKVFNEYDPPRFAVAEAWVNPKRQYLYAAPDELGQVFNFDFAKANWDADEMRKAIATGLKAAETSGSSTTWVMSNHDVPRHASRYGLPQVRTHGYHQIAQDWLLRDGTTYIEDRALGTRRARAAIMLEMALPGSAYIYQGEELGLFEVADIPWSRLEDPTALHSSDSGASGARKGRDGCRVPLPWTAADQPKLAEWSATQPADDGTGHHAQIGAAGQFGTGASFGFSPAAKPNGAPADDPHLPQPMWFKDYCADTEDANPDSMLNLYRRTLALRKQLLQSDELSLHWIEPALRDASGTANGTSADQPMTVLAFTRPAANSRTFTSVTNFGKAPIALPEGDIALVSGALTDDGKLPQDTTAWIVA